MDQKSDQRSEHRLQIDGAQVNYWKKKESAVYGRLYGPLPLKDISSNGVSFEIREHLKIGDSILVDIIIPNKDNIHAQGTVQWTGYNLDRNSANAGIYFKQFGWGEPWNFIPYESRLHMLVKQNNTKH